MDAGDVDLFLNLDDFSVYISCIAVHGGVWFIRGGVIPQHSLAEHARHLRLQKVG